MATVKLNERTLSILKNFQEINSAIVFKPGKEIDTISPTKKVLATATIEQEFDSTFGIYELNKFFGAISLFKNPELTIEKTFIDIHEGHRSLRYVIADPLDIRPPTENQFNKLPSVDVEFKLTEKTIKNAIKAAGVLNHKEIVLIGDGEKVVISTQNVDKPTPESYSEDVGEFTGDKPFKMIMKVENLHLFPGEYAVRLCFKMKIVQFEGKDVNYFVAAEANSTVSK